ncbi:MAG: toxin-antitoxin system YwqK family antitoxin [Crocinitomicaceae bacterium]
MKVYLIFLIPVFVLVSCGKSEENTSEASSVESQEVKIENGVKTVYYKGTDKVRFQGNVNKDTLWDGKVTAYHPNGKIMSIHSYINGIKNGIFQVYRENGKLYYTGEWESENKIGSWYYYDSLGKFVKEVSYEKVYD